MLALRLFARNPFFTAINVVGLVLAVFSNIGYLAGNKELSGGSV